MPSANATVNLNVTGAAPPDDTWAPCKKGGDQLDGFWYKFTGGNSGSDDGSLEFTVDESGNSPRFIDVKLVCADGWDPHNPATSQGYRITDVPISFDSTEPQDKQDLKVVGKTDPRCWQLKDSNKDEESGHFKVIVSYTPGGSNPSAVLDIECDPAWRNKK